MHSVGGTHPCGRRGAPCVWIIGTKRGSVRARSVRSKCVRTQGAIRRGTPRPCWPQGAMGSTTTWCWEVLVRARGRACVACCVGGRGKCGLFGGPPASLFPLPLSSQLTAAGGSPRSLHTIISSGVTVSRGAPRALRSYLLGHQSWRPPRPPLLFPLRHTLPHRARAHPSLPSSPPPPRPRAAFKHSSTERESGLSVRRRQIVESLSPTPRTFRDRRVCSVLVCEAPFPGPRVPRLPPRHLVNTLPDARTALNA
jgi:hypothetical protein